MRKDIFTIDSKQRRKYERMKSVFAAIFLLLFLFFDLMLDKYSRKRVAETLIDIYNIVHVVADVRFLLDRLMMSMCMHCDSIV